MHCVRFDETIVGGGTILVDGQKIVQVLYIGQKIVQVLYIGQKIVQVSYKRQKIVQVLYMHTGAYRARHIRSAARH